jgi:hypothetical protein
MADSPYGSKDAQVFFPKNRVKDKVGQGGIATDLLQKAREAVTAMEQDYSSIVEEQLADIWEIFFETQDGTLDRQQGIQRILNAAFNLKGEAQSYGYPVIGRIGNSLYRYTSANPTAESSMMLKIIKLHLEAAIRWPKKSPKTWSWRSKNTARLSGPTVNRKTDGSPHPGR